MKLIKKAVIYITAVFTFLMPAAEEVRANTVHIGDFSVLSVTDYKVNDSKVYVLEHDRTGAKVVYMKNDDPNKVFMLEFETPVDNNKGIPHVFEHSAMNGSVKYPSRSLTRAVYNRSYITYGNALTLDKCTVYPIASMSEKQLLKLADYYTDLCFEPLIMNDEDIFKSEAWRLTLDEEDGSIGIAGTIYSEMSGSYTADRESIRKALGMLYPGCVSSYDSGGVPSEILGLSYDEVKQFHEKYYHPSNATAYLYGDIKDVSAFLKLLDGYFDGYEKKNINITPSYKKTGDGYKKMKYEFPSADAKGGAEIVYALDLGNLSDDELSGMYAFASFCNSEDSPALLILRSLFPLSSFTFGIECDSRSAAFTVNADNMKEGDSDLFKNTVSKIFSDMANNGLGAKETENFRNNTQIKTALSAEGDNAAISLLTNMAMFNSNGRGELFYTRMRNRFLDMDWFTGSYIKSVAGKYLADPKRSVMSVVVKDHGLYEKNEKELSDTLDEIGKSMSEKDRKNLVEESERIKKAASDDPEKYLDELNVVKVSDLSDNVRNFYVSDSMLSDGARQIGIRINTKDICYNRLCFDASGLDQELLGYLALYTDLVNGHFVPAAGLDRGAIPSKINEVSYGGSGVDLIVTSLGDDYRPYVTIDFSCMPEKLEEAYDLASARMFKSSFSDEKQLLEGIGAIKNTIGTNITEHPENAAKYTAYAGSFPGAAYYENTHYISYYDFLSRLEEKKDLKDTVKKLNMIKDHLNNRNGAVICYACSKDSEKEQRSAVTRFCEGLDKKERKNITYSFAKKNRPLGVITGSKTLCNITSNNNECAASSGADIVALSVMTDRYLRPNTRDRYGAYACSYRFDEPAVAFYTGNDPVSKETLDVFAGMSDTWKDIRQDMTQKDLDGYIISLHSALNMSRGELNDAKSVLSDVLSGKGKDVKALQLKSLRNMKISDLPKYDRLFENMSLKENMVSFGPSSAIEKGSGTYARMISPFAK